MPARPNYIRNPCVHRLNRGFGSGFLGGLGDFWLDVQPGARFARISVRNTMPGVPHGIAVRRPFESPLTRGLTTRREKPDDEANPLTAPGACTCLYVCVSLCVALVNCTRWLGAGYAAHAQTRIDYRYSFFFVIFVFFVNTCAR